jgi:hypothetical protein
MLSVWKIKQTRKWRQRTQEDHKKKKAKNARNENKVPAMSLVWKQSIQENKSREHKKIKTKYTKTNKN